jgi:hypothetical protein
MAHLTPRSGTLVPVVCNASHTLPVQDTVYIPTTPAYTEGLVSLAVSSVQIFRQKCNMNF